MDCDNLPTLSEAHPETMDLLSRAWCDFAIKEAFQPECQNQALVLHECSFKSFDDGSTSPSFMKLESIKMDDTAKPLPPWKTNDVKSWIWMQQAMHPELNYSSCFRKKWKSWHIVPFKSPHTSIKKWLKEIKQKRKENERLQKAEVHAAISVASVAAALAAIASENANHDGSNSTARDSAVASAAALVAAHCAKTAEAMGAKKKHISTAMSSAMSTTNANDILTLTAAASTSLRGASTLKTRAGCKNRLNGNAPVLPIEENTDLEFDFDQCRLILRRGAELSLKTSDGRCIMRSVSVVLNHEAKVVLRTRKLNLLNAFSSKKESIVLDQHVELYKNSKNDMITCFLVVLTTTRGIIKLDMMNDNECQKLWTWTINHMLSLSTSFRQYSLPYYKN
uniref:VAN3-binding protein isoform X2 n=1 Tax=Erigeron canadensis TaxID=72917 RepID=UPI001CB91447|nr:VAN3-binding protein isoform X2 [Erigeron canadensis]